MEVREQLKEDIKETIDAIADDDMLFFIKAYIAALIKKNNKDFA